MKIRNIIIGAMLAAPLFTSCEESLPNHFEQIDGVYLNNLLPNKTHVDEADITFIYEDGDLLEVPVRVQLLGRMRDYARKVDIVVESDNAREGVDYELATAPEMPAEVTQFDYIVRLKRTPELEHTTKNLTVSLRANENFIIPFEEFVQTGKDTTSVVHYCINFSDQFTSAPEGWRTTFVGEFSKEKFLLICRVMDMPRSDFNDPHKISEARWMFIQSRMIEYVDEQVEKRDRGEEYDKEAFDSEGNPLVFGSK